MRTQEVQQTDERVPKHTHTYAAAAAALEHTNTGENFLYVRGCFGQAVMYGDHACMYGHASVPVSCPDMIDKFWQASLMRGCIETMNTPCYTPKATRYGHSAKVMQIAHSMSVAWIR